MFDKESRPTFVKLVVESADFVVESANYIADLITDPSRIGVWVRALSQSALTYAPQGFCYGIYDRKKERKHEHALTYNPTWCMFFLIVPLLGMTCAQQGSFCHSLFITGSLSIEKFLLLCDGTV